jgi:Predicted transcriptional regulator
MGNDFYKKIKEERNKTGMSQLKLSEALKIPLPTLKNWETKKAVPPDWQQKLVLAEIRKHKILIPAEMELNQGVYLSMRKHANFDTKMIFDFLRWLHEAKGAIVIENLLDLDITEIEKEYIKKLLN